MNTYSVKGGTKFTKQLKKLNPFVQKRIEQWIDKNLDGTTNPRLHGKPLSGELGKYWCYRIGDFRLLAEINDFRITIFFVEIEHRRSVYKH